MEANNIPRTDTIRYSTQIPLSVCVFCGNEFGNINFKGKCVCEDCIGYVKKLM